MPEGMKGLGAVNAADGPLARSAVADVEKDAVFDSIPEKRDFDPVALAEGEFVQALGGFIGHGS